MALHPQRREEDHVGLIRKYWPIITTLAVVVGLSYTAWDRISALKESNRAQWEQISDLREKVASLRDRVSRMEGHH